MATPALDLGAIPPAPVRGATFRRLVRRPAAAVPLTILGIIVLAVLLAPWISRHDPNMLDPVNQLAGPSSDHWFGTDELGRDLFARILYGGRLALGIAAASTVIALLGGIIWGGLAALVGGWIDEVLMRIGDAAMAIPFLLLALIFVAAFGASVPSLIAILGILHIPVTARIARAAVLTERHSDYYLAATVFGSSRRRLLFSEVLPNVVPTMMVQATLVAASVMLTEAALSFVGLGVQPPDASWGTLLLQGYAKIYSSYWYIMWAGLAIFITIWCLNAIADQLEAVLDPRDRS